MTANIEPCPFPGPSSRSKGEGRGESGRFASERWAPRVLAGGLALAAVLLLAPGAARAVNDCGALNAGNSFTEDCPDAAYATGIVYWDQPNAVTLTVPGTATTATITAGANNGVHNGITIRTNDDTTSPRTSPVRNIALTVGGSGTFVAIEQSGTRASSWYNNRGIVVFQRDGNGATTTVDVKSGVTIGTAMTKMESRGIEVQTYESDVGAVTVTSAATIYSEDDGIYVGNQGTSAAMVINSGAVTTEAHGIHINNHQSGDVTVTNSGDIMATKEDGSGGKGIYVNGRGPGGAVAVANSAAITADEEGIHARTIDKDTDGADFGVSVTHSAGVITSNNYPGIKAHVGQPRGGESSGETHDAYGDYVEPKNAGLARVAVTGGSVRSKWDAIQAINFEAGSVEVRVSSGVTLTSTDGHGIRARLADVGNTSGTITVNNAGTITAKDGITVSRVAGSGAVAVENSGAIEASGHGISAVDGAAGGTVSVTNSGGIEAGGDGIHAVAWGAGGAVSVTNSGPIGNADEKVSRGMFVSHAGSGASGDVTVRNSGAITAEEGGILAQTINKDAEEGANAGVTVTHSAGAIATEDLEGIRAYVGESRQESDATHDDYVEPKNAGLAKVEVTGGSVRSKWEAIEATNFEAGSVEVRVSEEVTLTSTHGHGVWVRLADAGNASGTITVTNAGTISAAGADRHGIVANRDAGSGAVSITNSGTVTAGGDGIFAVAMGVDGAMTITNRGTIGNADANADARVFRGIFVAHDGTGTGSVTVTNSGSIAAKDYGIFAVDRGAGGAMTIVNSGAITAGRDGIFARTTGKDAELANAGVTVTHSAGAIASADGRGIKVHVGEPRQETDTSHDDYVAPRNEGLLKVEVTGGSINSKWEPIEAYNHEAGSVEVRVASGVTLTSKHGHGIWGGLTDAGNASGKITIDNAGTIRVPKSGITFAIGGGSGDVTVNNSGALEVDGDGIFAVARAAVTGNISITNRGAIGKADARVARGIFASHDGTGATGAVTVANSGDIMATKQGILAQTKFLDAEGADDGVTVTHSAGTIDVTDAGRVDSDKQGIVARVGNWRQERDSSHAAYVAPKNTGAVKIDVTGGKIAAMGSAVEGANYEAGNVEINVARGVTLRSTHEHAIEADLRDVGNEDGTIAVTQAGTISASGDGISAKVTRISAKVTRRNAVAAPPDRPPVIDIVWTGTFTALEEKRGSLPNVARAVEAAQGLQAERATLTGGEDDERLLLRFAQGSAGIDAGVMKWQTFMRPVSEGDDPGAFADKAAQDALFDADADAATKARAAAIVARFKSVLENEALGTIPGADAIDTNDDDTWSDAEIVAYLSEDDDDRRTLLRNVLAQSFTEREMDVFRAVIADGDVDIPLAAVPAGYTNAWREEVRDLLDAHNPGNIRIAMNGGSIASRGDGIRAFFGRTHDDNGAIRVNVAKGASVTGGMAGIYVENAGHGLSIEKKYTSPAVQEKNKNKGPDDLVTFPEHHDQIVTVNGTVTGGKDAAVHLAGGGALIVGETGKLVAGTSGRAVLVNHPGPAAVYIDGEVTGGEGAPAAVDLTGGGSVIVDLNGSVKANGADSVIRGDMPTVVVVLTDRSVGDLTRKSAREILLARVRGRFAGDGIDTVTIAEVRDGVTTGHMRENLPIGGDGNVIFDQLPPIAFRCAMAGDRRCRLYEALPSMLLVMNDLPSYAERMSAARDGNGGWARVEAAFGKWQAARAASAGKLAYDHRRTAGRAGFDLIAGESGQVGVSLHVQRGKAEMSGVGEATLDGAGAGISATWLPDLPVPGDLYVDAQAGTTRYDVVLDSTRHGRLVKDADATGYAVGVEAGNRMALGEGLMVTPRAGLVWSKVDLKGFMDLAGSHAQVSMKDARSTKGRLGVTMETAAGAEESPGRVFGSLDVEHEFSDETEVVVSGNKLGTKLRTTAVRVGLGGVFSLDEDVSLRASANYTTSGGNTNEYGGSVELNLRF